MGVRKASLLKFDDLYNVERFPKIGSDEIQMVRTFSLGRLLLPRREYSLQIASDSETCSEAQARLPMKEEGRLKDSGSSAGRGRLGSLAISSSRRHWRA
jgi:hypothetical protein